MKQEQLLKRVIREESLSVQQKIIKYAVETAGQGQSIQAQANRLSRFIDQHLKEDKDDSTTT